MEKSTFLNYGGNFIFVDDQMLKFIQDSKTFNFIPRFNIVLFQIKVSKMLKVIFIDLVLRTYLAAIVSDQEKFLNIDQSRRKDINLAPVK